MTDLTSEFRHLVGHTEQKGRKAAPAWLIRDSFLAECRQLYVFVSNLQSTLRVLETQRNSQQDEEELDQLDVEFRLQLQGNVNKYRQLEQYETKRRKLIDDQLNTLTHNVAGWFHRDQTAIKQYHLLNNKFRNGVLNSLNLIIHQVSNEFARLQQERLSQRRKLDTLQFLQDGSDSSVNLLSAGSPTITTTTTTGNEDSPEQNPQQYDEIMNLLTQEQIQILETEHQELLNEKQKQLNNVQRINTTLLDILSIQNELSQHLQIQSQNINNMLDNQDDIETNIQQGNKQLHNAKKSASRTAMWTKWLAILLTVMILWFDFIN